MDTIGAAGEGQRSARFGSGSRMVTLDGLRGVAAITVMLLHLQIPGLPLLERGYLMVDLFFVLSGFVLACTFEDRLRADLPAWRFLWRRYWRLWPVVAIGTLIGGVAVFLEGDTLWGLRAWLMFGGMGLLLVPTVWITREAALFPLNRPLWSIFFELVANAAHALLLVRLGERALLAIALVCGAALALITWDRGDAMMGPLQSDWHQAFARVGFSYVIGVWLARRWQRVRPRLLAKGPLVPAPIVLALPLASIALVMPLPQPVGDMLVVLFALPAIIWLGASAPVAGRLAQAFAVLGALSYPLYAVHVPVRNLLEAANDGPASKWLAAALSLLVAGAVALTVERARLRRHLAATAGPQAPRPAD